MKTSRRTFLFASLSAVSTLAVTRQALAAPAAPAKAAETDPTAVALGYVADAAKVDKKKYAKYAAGQDCGNCSFYQGKASDPWAIARCLAASRWPARAGATRITSGLKSR